METGQVELSQVDWFLPILQVDVCFLCLRFTQSFLFFSVMIFLTPVKSFFQKPSALMRAKTNYLTDAFASHIVLNKEFIDEDDARYILSRGETYEDQHSVSRIDRIVVP